MTDDLIARTFEVDDLKVADDVLVLDHQNPFHVKSILSYRSEQGEHVLQIGPCDCERA